MNIKSDWKGVNWGKLYWIHIATIILMILMLPLLIIIAVHNWQTYYKEKESNAISTTMKEQAKPLQMPQQNREE